MGRRRRPAGRDRPGLIAKSRRYRVVCVSGQCERIGLLLLQGQRRLTRQPRAPCSHPPPFPGPLCGPVLDRCGDPASLPWSMAFDRSGRRDRRASRSWSWRCCGSNDGLSAAGSGEVAGGAAASDSGVATAAIFTSALAAGASGGAAGVVCAGLLGRFFRLCRLDLRPLCRRQCRQFLRPRPEWSPAFDRPAAGDVRNGRRGIVRRRLLRAADRPAAAPGSAAASSLGGQTSARAAPVATEGWQIPRARRAAARRRRARKSGPTSTARSRRTGNESREAWTRVPPCLISGGLLSAKGTR